MYLFAEVLMYENFDLKNIITPIKAEVLELLLTETGYDKDKTKFLVQGFQQGFPLNYQGPTENIQKESHNLKLRIGDEVDLWNKVMKEVKLKRYAGSFKSPPFKNYIQSPIGLVPKDGG